MDIKILHRDDLPLGGFAGLTEHRLVTDPRVFGDNAAPGSWEGLGNFVYLSDARFQPHGDTHLHSHSEIDVISIMIDGRIQHEGSLEHGKELKPGDVQVQRAGGEGFRHNEINPDDDENRMLQLWALPETPGEPAAYKFYPATTEQRLRVYGGAADQDATFASRTLIDVIQLDSGQRLQHDGPFLAYLFQGEAGIDSGKTLQDGHLFRGDRMQLEATSDCRLVLVTTT